MTNASKQGHETPRREASAGLDGSLGASVARGLGSGVDPGFDPASAGGIVDEYLRIVMIPDPEAAQHLIAPAMRIRFTGGRAMSRPADCTAFNAGRYAWVKKRIARTDVVAGGTPEETIVYSLGTLYGAWPDGTPFEGNRYVDRYVVSHGLITHMDVWNDSAEWILTPGLAAEALAANAVETP